MNAIVVDNIDKTLLISANKKLHYQHAGKVRAYWRGLAYAAALTAYGTADHGCAWWPRAHVTLTIRFPDRRRHDVANLYNYVAKPIVDGLVDARVIPDDDDLHLIGPDLRRDQERGPHRITIRIEDW